MKNYTIVLLDENQEHHEQIMKESVMQSLGFTVLARAKREVDVWRLALRLRPDVILGMEISHADAVCLQGKLQKILPFTKLLLFSNTGKPDDDTTADMGKDMVSVNMTKDMEKLLAKLHRMLDRQYEDAGKDPMGKQRYEDSLPMIRNYVLITLLEGTISETQLHQWMDLTMIDGSSLGSMVALLKFHKEIYSAVGSEAIRQVIMDDVNGKLSCEVFPYGKQMVIVINVYEETDMETVLSCMADVRLLIKQTYDFSTAVGISGICHHPRRICHAYQEAQTALDYRLILGDDAVIAYPSLQLDTSFRLHFCGQAEEAFWKQIRTGDSVQIQKAIDELLRQMTDRILMISQYHMYAAEILLSLSHLIQTHHMEEKHIFVESMNLYDPLRQFHTVQEFGAWLLVVSLRLHKQIIRNRVSSSMLTVEKAKHIIVEQYADRTLSVETISAMLHISSPYLSTVFKKETGCSLISYLTGQRLTNAVQLLESSDEKSYQIAEKVGYSDANYFSYVFKKSYGVSPSRYRKEKNSG